ncbi:unnamed protein product [Amoebophrya sp. A120]|nr:unnamed protein product [Amoebophrya sp. A120]|eukprot:GSA120T00007978001.1
MRMQQKAHVLERHSDDVASHEVDAQGDVSHHLEHTDEPVGDDGSMGKSRDVTDFFTAGDVKPVDPLRLKKKTDHDVEFEGDRELDSDECLDEDGIIQKKDAYNAAKLLRDNEAAEAAALDTTTTTTTTAKNSFGSLSGGSCGGSSDDLASEDTVLAKNATKYSDLPSYGEKGERELEDDECLDDDGIIRKISDVHALLDENKSVTGTIATTTTTTSTMASYGREGDRELDSDECLDDDGIIRKKADVDAVKALLPHGNSTDAFLNDNHGNLSAAGEADHAKGSIGFNWQGGVGIGAVVVLLCLCLAFMLRRRRSRPAAGAAGEPTEDIYTAYGTATLGTAANAADRDSTFIIDSPVSQQG